MRKPIKMLVSIVAATLVIGGAAPVASADDPPVIYPRACVASDPTYANWMAMDFISACRKGSILREFPGEYYYTRLSVIRSAKSAAGKKAWKLLNDNRFKK